MVSTAIWEDEEFTKLEDKAKLLYIGCITVADDDGRLRGNSVLLRSQIFPVDEKVTVDDVRKWLNRIVKSKLLVSFKVGSEYFLQHPNWEEYQVIRSDLYKPSKFPQHPDFPSLRDRNGNVTKKHPKVTKGNSNKDKEEEKPSASLAYLSKIPDEDMKEFVTRFEASAKMIQSKAEDLMLWCNANRKIKKDYKSFLLNSLKKDFAERKETSQKQVPAAERVEEQLTPEQEEQRRVKLAEIRSDLQNIGVIKK